jgi:cysteinyl-tRNA synthetase
VGARQAWAAALGGAPALVVPRPAAQPPLVRVETVSTEVPDDVPAEAGRAAPSARPLAEVARRCAAAFGAALDDDLNTAGALGQLFELVRAGNAALAAGDPDREGLAVALEVLTRAGDVLGLWEGAEPAASAGGDGAADRYRLRAERLVQLLLELRAEARAYRDWLLADRIRAGLSEVGVVVEDTPQGTRWRWEEARAATGAGTAAPR